MSVRQHRTCDIVAEGQLARLLAGEPASPVENTSGLTPPSFPPDAGAVIYRPSRSVVSSGRANTGVSRGWGDRGGISMSMTGRVFAGRGIVDGVGFAVDRERG